MTPTIVTSSSFIKDAARAELVRMWADVVVDRLPRHWPVVLFDNRSPIRAVDVLGDKGFVEIRRDQIDATTSGRLIVVETEDKQYLKDGWDHCTNSILASVAIGNANGYEYALYLESDMILCRPAEWIVDRMRKHKIVCAAPWCQVADFLETNIMGFDVEACMRLGLIEAWQNRVPRGGEWPELWFERFFGDAYHSLPFRGDRDDLKRLTRLNALYAYPRGWDYLTHCDDIAVYKEMLRRNCIDIPSWEAPMLSTVPGGQDRKPLLSA